MDRQTFKENKDPILFLTSFSFNMVWSFSQIFCYFHTTGFFTSLGRRLHTHCTQSSDLTSVPHCSGLTWPQGYVHPRSQNVTLFGTRVFADVIFADVIKGRMSSWDLPGLGWSLNPVASVCIRDRKGEDTDMEKRRRVETAGDLGPFAAVLTLRQMSPPATQEAMGLKITLYMCSWDTLWTKRYKKTKTQLPLLESWDQKQGDVHAACTHHHERGRKPSKPPLWNDPWTHLTFTPYKEQAHPSSRSKPAREPVTCSHCPPCWHKGPNKALPEFLVWPLINFYWLRRPRILVHNNVKMESETGVMYLQAQECDNPQKLGVRHEVDSPQSIQK